MDAGKVPSSNVTLKTSGSYAGHALEDMSCLTVDTMSAGHWGLYLASRAFLLSHGWTEQYFTEHFCVIAVEYAYRGVDVAGPYGAAGVAYKATFPPYVLSWVHDFPTRVDARDAPVLTDGVATIDETNGHYPPELVPAVQSVLSPAEVIQALEAVAGPLTTNPMVNMGPSIGRKFVRLYAGASQLNPKSTACTDRFIEFLVDVETGEAVEQTYNGPCQ
jgi:hypothetical protein